MFGLPGSIFGSAQHPARRTSATTGTRSSTPNTTQMKRSRQRYGMLLLALSATFFFQGVAEPGDLQRAIGTVLVGLTLLLALRAAEVPPERQRIAVVIVAGDRRWCDHRVAVGPGQSS